MRPRAARNERTGSKHVPGENLTRIEAQERAALVSTKTYEIGLDLTTGDEVFRSTTRVLFSATPGASTFIDALTRTVHSVTLNGAEIGHGDNVRIPLPDLAAENELVVVADFEYTNTGEGLHRFVDPVDGEVYLYSQFEVPDSRRVFAVFEQPDLKATFQFTVTAPARWEVVSNSPTPTPVPVSTSSTTEAATWSFAPTPILSSYVTALVAGPYAVVRSELTSSDGRVIPLGIFSRKSLSEFLDADYIFEKTREGFEFYEKHFAYPYPFEKYDQLFVPEFNAGAMENAGAVTFTETYVFRSKVTDAIKERRVVTILHELAHMWFGDLVTMKWWNDLWLNESFAEWASTLATAEATEWHEAWTTFNAMEKTWAYRQDQLPSTHPVVATINDLEDVQVNFDGITYAKGGSVLKQLVAWVGLEEFMAGVAAYFQKHQYGNTELSDLLAELEKTSGRELTSWSKLWLETAGVNTLRPVFETDDAGTITSFVVLQEADPEYPTIRPHRLAIGLYNLHSGKLMRDHRVEIDVDGVRTEVPELVGQAKPDLVLVNDEDLAYAKIRLDEHSLAVAMEHLEDIDNPLARSIVWGAAWDATRDAEASPSDYVQLVLNNIAAETESTADHVATLNGLLDGSITLDGLEIDTDLRWELLEGLALNGATDAVVIDAALEKDNTSNGQQAAARAHATLPTAEAKRAAFDSLVSKDDLPNVIVRNVTVGYQHTNDPSSLTSLIEPYFAMLNEIWTSRSYKIAEYVVLGLYPSPLASQELVDATNAWLAANPDVPALRRLVVENLAGVERALKAQARDRA
jgi:aminopeptidase N